MGKCFAFRIVFYALLLTSCGTSRKADGSTVPPSTTRLRNRQMRRLVDFAALQLKAPYKWGGTTPKGFDCSGFTWYCFNHFDVQLPRTAAEQSKSGKKVRGRRSRTGDLIFFKGPDLQQKQVGHVGIVVGGRKQMIRFIHAGSKGITVSSLREEYFQKRYKGIQRVRR